MKTYLGDGVYVEYTEQEIILTTGDGINTTNKIYLDGYILASLLEFIKKVNSERAVITEAEVDKMRLAIDDNGWDN